MAIGSAVLVAGWLGLTAQTTAVADTALASHQAELTAMQARIAAVKAAGAKGDVAARAASLEARQAFLAALLSDNRDMTRLAAMLPRAEANAPAAVAALVARPAATSGSNVRGKRGAAQPVTLTIAPPDAMLEPVRQLEAQQQAMVEQAAGTAQARLKGTEALLRRLGLDPARFAGTGELAVGGPYVPAGADGSFRNLYMSWQKLSAMQSAIAAIPAFTPVKEYRYTSDFGERSDPFNGGAAVHQGVDMAGSHGEPIYAAASGTVDKAGVMNGYGNVIMLDHGKGIETRYGHLSKVLVKPGEFVRQGQLIGRMGSTGRSTGTHLHYEIRLDGRAVDPRPFLDASAYVLAAQAPAPMGPPASAAPLDGGSAVTIAALR